MTLHSERIRVYLCAMKTFENGLLSSLLADLSAEDQHDLVHLGQACFSSDPAVADKPHLPQIADFPNKQFSRITSRRTTKTRVFRHESQFILASVLYHLIHLSHHLVLAEHLRRSCKMAVNEEQARVELGDKFGSAVTDHPDVMAECE